MIPCSWVDWHPQKLVRSFFMDVPVSSSSIELPMSMKMRSQWFNLSRHILKQISLVSKAHFSHWIIVSKDRDKNWTTIIHWERAVLAITDKWVVGNEIEVYTFVRSDRKFQKNKNPPHFIIFLSSGSSTFFWHVPCYFCRTIKATLSLFAVIENLRFGCTHDKIDAPTEV